MAKEKVMVLSIGIMVKYLKEIGKMESNQDLESGDHLREITIKVNGLTTGKKDKGNSSTKIVHIEDNLKIL